MREMRELFDVRLKARSLAYLFTAGGALQLVTLLLPHDRGVDDTGVAVVALLMVGAGAVVWLLAPRMAEWHLHLALAAGTLALGLANYYADTTALFPMLFTWTALYAFYFFDLRLALAHLALIGVAYGVVLAAEEPTSPVVRWLLAVGTPAVVGVLISRALASLSAQWRRAAGQDRAVAEGESRMRLILESVPDAFMSIERNGIVVGWNASAEQMFGWTAEEVLGKPVRGLISPHSAGDEHDARRASVLESDDPSPVLRTDVELERRDGSRFPAEETLTRVRVEDELIVCAFIRDIGERRRREEQREVLVREQSARAEAERVAELASGMQILIDAALAHRTLDDMLDDLLPRVRAVLHAEVATFFLADEDGDTLRIRGSTAGGNPGGGPVVISLEEGFAGRIATERRPMLVHDPDPAGLRDPALRDMRVSSIIGVPLLTEGEVRGVLEVSSSERRFSEEDFALLRLAADRVALAVDHARVYEREHRIAETLQRSLLPERLPQLPGLAVAARYEPAAAEAEVGGDWYDVVAIPGGGVGLVMGDVAGKGLAAASMVGRLRSALRAYALEGHPPAAVAEQLNRLLWAELDDSQMATLMYLVVDPGEGTIQWVNAGHPPPLLVVGEGMTHFLEGGRGVPLGVLPFPTFEELSTKMEPGSMVVLYTDGLVERPGEHLDRGLERLAGVVRDAGAGPEELLDRLLSELVPPGGAPDDVALLALRNTPMADHFSVELPREPEALASMRGLLRRWLAHAEGTDQEIAEITTACGEAATNVIEHSGASAADPFEIDGKLDGREVDIVVRDAGGWREPRDADRGRGISLMRALMDEVEVEPSDEGTTVRLRRVLNGRPES